MQGIAPARHVDPKFWELFGKWVQAAGMQEECHFFGLHEARAIFSIQWGKCWGRLLTPL